jgi:hypothetical protein
VPPARAPRVLVLPKVSVQSVAAPSKFVRLVAGGLGWTVPFIPVCGLLQVKLGCILESSDQES